jgi:hypothetical protein
MSTEETRRSSFGQAHWENKAKKCGNVVSKKNGPESKDMGSQILPYNAPDFCDAVVPIFMDYLLTTNEVQ